MDSKLTSILLTTYKGERYIRRALQSILDQTYPHYEVVVVDEYGKDDTKAIIDSFQNKKIRYFQKSDEGPGAAVKYGLAKCRFDLVAIFEHDDYWFETKLEKQILAFAQNPGVALVATDWCYGEQLPAEAVSALREHTGVANGYIFENLLRDNFLVTSSVMMRKSVVEEVGFPNIQGIEKGPWDRHLWMRIARKYPVMVLPEILVWKFMDRKTSLYFAVGNSCELGFLGWLKALDEFRDIEPLLIEVIKHNIATSALDTAMHYLTLNKIDLYKKYMREALKFDAKYVLKSKHAYVYKLPATLIKALRSVAQAL